jgi:type I restriction enzyme, S subunit
MNYPVVEIGKHCIQTEQFDPRVFPDRPFQYIDISSIDKDSKLITSTTQILGKDAPSRARKQVHHNDVLVSSVRPNLNAVAMVPEELDGEIASTGFCVLRPDPDALVSRFLFYRTMSSIEQ